MSHQQSHKDQEGRQNCERPEKPYPLESDQQDKHKADRDEENRSDPLTREDIHFRWRRSVRLTIGLSRVRLAPLPSLSIIRPPRSFVSEHAVSFVERLHLFFVAAAIWMMLHGKTFVETIYLALRRVFVRAKYRVIIFVGIEPAHCGLRF